MSAGANGDQTATALLGARIREERLRAGISGAELSRRSGVSRSWLSKVERGWGHIGTDHAARVAKAMGIPVWELFRARQAGVRTEEELAWRTVCQRLRPIERAILLAGAERLLEEPEQTRREISRFLASLHNGESSKRRVV